MNQAKNSKFYEIKSSAKTNFAEIYIYGYIGNSIWDEVNPKSLIDDLKAIEGLKKIEVHINSGGGSVYGGNAIYNALKMHDAEVDVYIEGLAASMASVIAMAGDNVYIADNSMIMIHDPWTWADGNAEELRKIADQLDKAKKTLVKSYVKKTGLPDEDIENMMSQETYLDADEAIEMGFADHKTESIDIAACITGLDLSWCKNLPKHLIEIKSESTGQHNEESTMDDEKIQGSVDDTGKNKETLELKIDASEVKAEIEAAANDAAQAALKAEAKRRCDISEVFKPFNGDFSELERSCMDDMNISASDAQSKLLDAISKKPAESLGFRSITVDDSRGKVRAGLVESILCKAGVVKDNTQNEFRSYSLMDVARACLDRCHVNTRGMNKMDIVAAAFTHSTSDFPNVLADILNKGMLKGWDEAPETFDLWTSRGILTDFREAKRVGINTFPNLDALPEGAEYKYGTVGDRGETIQLATYGKMVSITRQAIINDDLNAFTKIPMMMGRAARRTIGNLVYNILNNNPVMADGTAIFDALHKNLGTSGVITTASLDEMRSLMATQTDAVSSGNAVALGITPKYMLVPEALRGKAIATVESETEIAASQNNSKRPNYARNIASVISDARLAPNAYYLTADPALYDTIEVAYLDGVDTPYLEQQMGWNVDGTAFKVRIDAGVKALDHRTMTKNAGV